jgi:hypothetical protein
VTREEDAARQRAERDDYERRLAERDAEQQRLHAADPEHHSLLIPVDDPDFPSEAYTAGWSPEEGA